MTLQKVTVAEFLIGKPEPTSNYWRNFSFKLSRKRSKKQLKEATDRKDKEVNLKVDVTLQGN